jgi:hypothetical protein
MLEKSNGKRAQIIQKMQLCLQNLFGFSALKTDNINDSIIIQLQKGFRSPYGSMSIGIKCARGAVTLKVN